MVKMSVEIVTCPDCGRKREYTIYPLLGANDGPILKEQLLTEQLHQCQCTNCGRLINITYDMMYHDSEHGLIVYIAPKSSKDEAVREFENIIKENEIKRFGCQRRIVFDTQRFLEKIMIFECGLDDRIVEIYKCFMYYDLRKTNPNIVLNDLYFAVQGNKRMIAAPSLGLQAFFLDDLYDGLRKMYINHVIFDEGYFIDSEWAFPYAEAF